MRAQEKEEGEFGNTGGRETYPAAGRAQTIKELWGRNRFHYSRHKAVKTTTHKGRSEKKKDNAIPERTN